MLGGNLSPDFSAILKLAGVEGGLENNIFRGKARVFEGEQGLLDALDKHPERFQNHDMIIVRYEGPSGAPGMPEMLDPTSRITTLCRERGIVVALMTDARFSGGSVGLVIGHVGPEAALGGPIAFIEDGDEIVADLNTNELNCTALTDAATLAKRKAAWDKAVADNGGIHPNCGMADTRLLHRARTTRGAGDARRRPASQPRGLGARAAQGGAVQVRAQEQAPPAGEQDVLDGRADRSCSSSTVCARPGGRSGSTARRSPTSPGIPSCAAAPRASPRSTTASTTTPANACTPSPPSGELTNVSHMIPRSKDELRRRHAGLVRLSEGSMGIMGRTPDYMNMKFAAFASAPKVWAGADGRNERGARNIVAFQQHLAHDDVSLTHTIIQPTIDKRTDSKVVGNKAMVRKVGETADGIIVRGAKVLATLAPYADEQAVYPGQPLPADAKEFALAFAIPLDTPGLKFLCRDSAAAPGADPFDKPLSSRFDEQDAFCIFDDVLVPWDRVFIDGDVADLQLDARDRLRHQHDDAVDHPRPHQARVRLWPGDAHGRADRRLLAGDDGDAGRARLLRAADRQCGRAVARAGRASAATACGSPTARRSSRCARSCRCGCRGWPRSSL